MARRKAQNPYGSCLAARRRLAARHSRTFAATGPALVRSVAHLCADRAFSQLLAGTPSGPGGSPDAARVPRCDEARGRRTSSRLSQRLARAPLRRTRWVHLKRGLGGGDYAGITQPFSSSRRKPGSRTAGTERTALDTGFCRFDGVWGTAPFRARSWGWRGLAAGVARGKCIGANSCKGKSDCGGKNGCPGQNA